MSSASIYIFLLFLITLLVWYYSLPSGIPWTCTSIPIVGSALAYAADPVRFLQDQRGKLGDVFRVDLLVVRVTVLLSPSVRLHSKSQICRMLTRLWWCSGTDGSFMNHPKNTSHSGKRSYVCTLV